jgi:uncharacterized protein with GYD domain
MAKYLWHGSYTMEGINGVRREGGTGRVKAIGELVKSVGGTLESFYWGFGKDDFWIILDLPGNVEAAAAAITVAGTGAASVQTVPLLTAEDVDKAAHMSVNYRRPGG